MRAEIAFAPRLLAEPEAARYLGMSATMLRSLGLPRKEARSKRLYDRFDLDDYASALPYEGQNDAEEAKRADEAFGL
ncbi:hypothetical protein [Paracoccus aminophilus]|uniref:hypothetical protein n=1 Tax=Paracoccus aminophilus TaxID=34003 RepID=UPI00059F7C91|nr:hypothetical protein [Paracoccus aminophilus]